MTAFVRSLRTATCSTVVGGVLAAASSLFAAHPAAQQDAPPAAPPAATPATTAPAASADQSEAKEIIAKHEKAIGGADAISSITSSRYKAALDTPMGKMDVELASKKPGKILFRQGMGGMGSQEFGCDGEVGWATSPMSPEPQLLSREMVAEAADGADLQTLVRELGKRFKDFSVVGKTTFQGGDAIKVKMTHPTGQAMNAFFDAESGLVKGLQIESDSPQGPMVQTMVLSDWEEVGPVRVFKTMTIEQMGMTMTMKFTDFEFNSLDDALFAPPAKVAELAKERPATPAPTPDGGTAPTAPKQ